MIALFRFLIVLIIIVAAAGFIIYQLSSFLLGTRSVKRQIERDKDFFNAVLDELMEGLVDIDTDELKIMSVSPTSKSVNQGITTYEKGVISTIYQEPIVAYTLKMYDKNNKLLLMLRTKSETYSVLSEAETFKIFKNNTRIGTINDNYQLSLSESMKSEITATIEGSKLINIKIGNEEIAHINLRDEDGNFDTDRVFSLFHSMKSGHEESLLLLAIFHILIKPKLT